MSESRSGSNNIEHFYTVREVAANLLISEKTVRRWIDVGELTAHRLGRQLRISHSDLETFIRLRRETR